MEKNVNTQKTAKVGLDESSSMFSAYKPALVDQIVSVCEFLDVNHEMDVGLHGWVSTPPVYTKVHCHERALYF